MDHKNKTMFLGELIDLPDNDRKTMPFGAAKWALCALIICGIMYAAGFEGVFNLFFWLFLICSFLSPVIAFCCYIFLWGCVGHSVDRYIDDKIDYARRNGSK
jgi:uncharacterized membrane protein